MSTSTVGTNQHYVPRALLRGFLADPVREQVHVFDKRERRTFTTTIRNVASERDFYTLAGSDLLDASMNRADDLAAPILQKLRQTPTVRRLSNMQIGILSGFTTLQMIRTRAMLEQWRELGVQLVQRLGDMTPDFAQQMRGLHEPELQREMFLSAIPGQTSEFMQHLLNKSTLLFQADPSTEFLISDNPVARHNTTNPGDEFRGTLGLAVKGIEIYLPISSRLTLAFMCPSIAAGYETLLDELKPQGFINLKAHEYLCALLGGKPATMGVENVRFLNSLQVLNAERFVFSSSGNSFEDAQAMVCTNSDAARGPRITVR